MSRKTVFVRPGVDANGDPLVVLDPRTMQPLPVEGKPKPATPYWLRRIRCGDCLEGPAKAKAKAKAKAAKGKE